MDKANFKFTQTVYDILLCTCRTYQATQYCWFKCFHAFLIGSLPYKLLANSLREAAEEQYNNKFVKYF